MFNIVLGTDIGENCNGESSWMCLYRNYREVFKSSVEKMSRVNMEEIFKSQAQKVSFDRVAEKVREIEKIGVENIIRKSFELCPCKESFTVYFIPVPFEYLIVTNHSPEIGTFILYGVGTNFSVENLKIFLPHEYAHVVRLQEVLLPRGVDSPVLMTLGEIAIFEGLGVAFSMMFNNAISMDEIPKYAGLNENMDDIPLQRIISEFWGLKGMKFSDLPDDVVERYYGEKRRLYVVGTVLILNLISQGYPVCKLNRMKTGKIMNIIEKKISKTQNFLS